MARTSIANPTMSGCSHLRDADITGSADEGIHILDGYEEYVRLDGVTFGDVAYEEVAGQANGPAVRDGEPCP